MADFEEDDRDNAKSNAYRVLSLLQDAIGQAEQGKRSWDAIFNDIPIRDCLAQYTVLATTWHIDDIRDRFPKNTTDEELFDTLRGLQNGLSNGAVLTGNDWFDYELPEVRNEEEDEEEVDPADDDAFWEEDEQPQAPHGWDVVEGEPK